MSNKTMINLETIHNKAEVLAVSNKINENNDIGNKSNMDINSNNTYHIEKIYNHRSDSTINFNNNSSDSSLVSYTDSTGTRDNIETRITNNKQSH